MNAIAQPLHNLGGGSWPRASAHCRFARASIPYLPIGFGKRLPANRGTQSPWLAATKSDHSTSLFLRTPPSSATISTRPAVRSCFSATYTAPSL